MHVLVFAAVKFDQVEGGKIALKMEECVYNILPLKIRLGFDLFMNNFRMNISSQWDPLNHHDYLMWPVVNGPEAWAATCHFSSTIKECIQPLIRSYLYPNPLLVTDLIVPTMFYLILCDHQATLTDRQTNNAKCVHQRMLSDDVQRCLGLLYWSRGKTVFIANKAYKSKRWRGFALSSMYECINIKGNWRHSCGAEVEAMMNSLTKSFSRLAVSYPYASWCSTDPYITCDICKPNSDIQQYVKFNNKWLDLLWWLLVKNQNPFLFTQCKVVDYPLNDCHRRLTWRRDVYGMFCQIVRNRIVPVMRPHLPLCNIGDRITSAVRICNMGYDKFMETSSHIARCTKNQDELFPCYKGMYMGYMSWGLVSAGRVLGYEYYSRLGHDLRSVYGPIKDCSRRLYDHLSQTCRHGRPVVQLIKDLRTVLMMDLPGIFSYGPFWDRGHAILKRYEIHVNQC